MNAVNWPSWTDEVCWVPTEEDSRWASESLNDDWHDLEGHPVIDDDTIDEADPWTTGDEYEADGHFDDVADESAWMDAYERGLKTF